jgi:hypothetical protein
VSEAENVANVAVAVHVHVVEVAKAQSAAGIAVVNAVIRVAQLANATMIEIAHHARMATTTVDVVLTARRCQSPRCVTLRPLSWTVSLRLLGCRQLWSPPSTVTTSKSPSMATI